MADETKTTKASKTPKAAKAPKAKKADSAEKVAAAATDAPAGEPCRVEKCKQAVRAKGYCRKHYIGWRRGAVGNKHRYKVCSKEGCRKPRTLGGLCDEHGGKAAGAPAEAAG